MSRCFLRTCHQSAINLGKQKEHQFRRATTPLSLASSIAKTPASRVGQGTTTATMETSSFREQTKIGSHLLLPQQKQQQQQQHFQHKHHEPYPFQRSSSTKDRAVKGVRSINHDLVKVKQQERVATSNSSCISHSSTGSSTCNDTYTTTGSRVSDKPLVCLEYMTQQLYEMANGVNLPAAAATTTEHHYQSSIISQCPWTDSVAKEATLLSTTLASAATSMLTYSVTGSSSSSDPTETSSPAVLATDATVGDPATPTAITKRRRKEDGTASGCRRYSPEKQKRRAQQHRLRDGLSHSESLLDGQSQTTIGVNGSSSPSRRRLQEVAKMRSGASVNDNTWMMDDNDDDQSELEGDRIPLHGQQQQHHTPNSTTLSPIQNYHMAQELINHPYGSKQDDLSYTYSESEASPRPVAKDLLQELVWEKLNDNDDDDDDLHHDQNDDHHSYGGESYDSSQKGLATTTAVGFATLVSPPSVSRGANGNSRTHPDIQGTNSLVGEVITVTDLEPQQQQKQVSSNSRVMSLRSSDRKKKKKKTATVECRRVSDCSSNDSESSSSACESISLTSSQEDHSLSVSSSTSCTSSSSERSHDSGVIFDRQQDIADRKIDLQSNSSPSRSVHFQLDKRHDNEGANNLARAPYAQLQKSCTAGSKKRKEQSSPSSSPSQKLIAPAALSPSRIHDRNRARTDNYQNNDNNSFLFPLQHVFSVESLSGGSTLPMSNPIRIPNGDKTVSSRKHPVLQPRRRASSVKSNDSDASILVDLTKDLKDIALYAGKSSGDLVTSLYHTLCEE